MDSIIVNLLPIATGGGLQNAMSFLRGLDGSAQYVVVVRKGTPLEREARRLGLDVIVIRAGLFGRLWFELFGVRSRFLKGQRCFTLFGPPLLRSVGFLYNIVGCAYSNLFYPEIDFWGSERRLTRVKRYLVDRYRMYGVLSADEVVFETEALRQRASRVFKKIANKTTRTVMMAPSRLVMPEKVDSRKVEEFRHHLPEGFNILYLAGPHPNKCIDELVDVVAGFNRRRAVEGKTLLNIVLTLDEKDSRTKHIMQRASALRGAGQVVNIGSQPVDSVASLIYSCDAVVNVARLESFSNNFVEAWVMGKPLVVRDAEWARGCCGEGALYIEMGSISETNEAFALLIDSVAFREKLVRDGQRQLSRHPTNEQRSILYKKIMTGEFVP